MNAPHNDLFAAGNGVHAALHSYVHLVQRPRVKPYFKVGRIAVATRAAGGGGPWSVPDLCAAYNWPTGLTGGGVIAIVELIEQSGLRVAANIVDCEPDSVKCGMPVEIRPEKGAGGAPLFAPR